jgi:hypothetical protein
MMPDSTIRVRTILYRIEQYGLNFWLTLDALKHSNMPENDLICGYVRDVAGSRGIRLGSRIDWKYGSESGRVREVMATTNGIYVDPGSVYPTVAEIDATLERGQRTIRVVIPDGDDMNRMGV